MNNKKKTKPQTNNKILNLKKTQIDIKVTLHVQEKNINKNKKISTRKL